MAGSIATLNAKASWYFIYTLLPICQTFLRLCFEHVFGIRSSYDSYDHIYVSIHVATLVYDILFIIEIILLIQNRHGKKVKLDNTGKTQISGFDIKKEIQTT